MFFLESESYLLRATLIIGCGVDPSPPEQNKRIICDKHHNCHHHHNHLFLCWDLFENRDFLLFSSHHILAFISTLRPKGFISFLFSFVGPQTKGYSEVFPIFLDPICQKLEPAYAALSNPKGGSLIRKAHRPPPPLRSLFTETSEMPLKQVLRLSRWEIHLTKHWARGALSISDHKWAMIIILGWLHWSECEGISNFLKAFLWCIIVR